ncbi:MAG: hypothetical protein WCV00_22525 [Verrucomicrobiia bacterium]
MSDAAGARKTVTHNHVSEETKKSLFRLLSALGVLLVAPLFIIALRSMVAGYPTPFRFGVGITAMALPEALALVWAGKVLRQERHVWRKAHHRRHGRKVWRVTKRLLFFAVALAFPASIAVTIWFL